MNWKYPEIFDLTDVGKFQENFFRKETTTREWDLSLWEVGPDIYGIPLFTGEFCDKLISNYSPLKGNMIKIWDHLTEKIDHNDELSEIMRIAIADYLLFAIYHVWFVDTPSIHKRTWNYNFYKFRKNQDLRVRHDGSFLTFFVNFDDKLDGGELYFPKYNFELKPKQGYCYFYPGRITHRYGIKLLESTESHSLITYIN